LHVAAAMTGADIRRVVARVIGRRGAPDRIGCDNGSEFVSDWLVGWLKTVKENPLGERDSGWISVLSRGFVSRSKWFIRQVA
jgi:hypothetical protein